MNNSESGFRAYVDRDFFMFDGLRIWLVDRRGQRRALMVSHTPVFEEADETIQHEPSLRLEDGAARALLDALAAYFGGTGELQTLRRDYEAERKRVDRFIEHLTRRDSPNTPPGA